LGEGLRFIYSGTLAMKHNPALLLALAKMLDAKSLGQLIVVSEGAGVEGLTRGAAAGDIRARGGLGVEPVEGVEDVDGGAAGRGAIVEPDGGVFSVPSKVLSYLCAARPVLLAVPAENLAARIVVESGAGVVVEPDNLAGFCAAAVGLAEMPARREECGLAAR